MQDFGTKSDNTAGPSGQLSASEFNNLATENENAVLRSGQALSGASETQLCASLFIHSVKAGGFQDNGSANTYVGTPISGSSGVFIPVDYSALDGALISFVASNTNSGASTLNIGQTTGALLGPKEIRDQSDAAITANTIVAGRNIQVRYSAAFNGGAGAWVIMPWTVADNAAHGLAVFNSSGTWTVPSGVTQARVHVIGGGGGGGREDTTAGGGGGAGGEAESLISLIGVTSVPITVGLGGAGAVVTGVGATGGTSSFGAFLSATGGTGGGTVSGGVGGTSAGLSVNRQGQGGGQSSIPAQGGGFTSGVGGNGARARALLVTSAGETYENPGSGGGGSILNSNGGAGRQGAVIIRW